MTQVLNKRDLDWAWMIEAGKCVWKTRNEGTKLLADMDCGHLRNARTMVLRNRQAALAEAEACAGYSGSDMAEMYADHAMSDAFDRAEKYRAVAAWLKKYVTLREQYNMLLEGPK